jgi:hypothetical protein
MFFEVGLDRAKQVEGVQEIWLLARTGCNGFCATSSKSDSRNYRLLPMGWRPLNSQYLQDCYSGVAQARWVDSQHKQKPPLLRAAFLDLMIALRVTPR